MKMKKIISLLLVAGMSIATLTGCIGGTTEDNSTAEIALITDAGTIDDKSFNQGTWEGAKKYAEEAKKSHKYYKPLEKTTQSYLESIDLAVKNGAKIVLCPGYLFEESVFQAQTKYPDVKFVLFDGAPREHEKAEAVIKENTKSIFYAEEEAGFLAGYAAIKDGYRKLGFMGGIAVPAVIRYGYGFIQGAEYAAAELGLKDGEIDMKYTYVGNFDSSPENQTIAATWYNQGTEVIFGCGGGVGSSVMAAAQASTDKKAVGVDVDQSNLSDTVITSAIKGLGTSAEQALKSFYDGTFTGGKEEVLDMTSDAVGIVMSNAKFKTFTQADYDTIYKKLVDDENGVRTSIKDHTAGNSPADLGTKTVKVEFVK